MNKRVYVFLHVAVWVFMFIAPLTFLRGNGLTPVQYLINCMTPFLMMVVFYINYFWLTPHSFVIGKRRYYLLFNFIMVVLLAVFLHFWQTFTIDYLPFSKPATQSPVKSSIDATISILRNIITLATSGAAATAIVLAGRFQRNEDARLEAEAARAEAELRNLRSQINPHFLLNTLNNIYALTAFDTQRAQDAIQQLSKMLRHMLYDNQLEKVPLQDEVQFLESYVNLMKIRLPQTVDVQMTTSIKNGDLKLAPLMFISLVENAFKHGISPTEPSFIHVNIATEIEREGDHDIRDVFVCTIKNSNFPKSQKDRSGHGIGLQQVHRRLELAYPNRYEWTKGVDAEGKTYSSVIRVKL